MRKRPEANLKNALSVLILVASLAYLYFKAPRLRAFLSLDISKIVLLLAVSLLGYLAAGLSFKSQLRVFGLGVSFKEWFGLTMCHSMFNYYLPARGGTVVKAFYLKEKYGLGYSYYAALLAGSLLLGLAAASLVGLLIVFLPALFGGKVLVSWAAAFFFILTGVWLAGAIVQRLLKIKIRGRFARLGRFFQNLKDGLDRFSRHRRSAFVACLFMALFLLIMALRLYLCFWALNFDVRLWDVLLIMAVTQFSFLVSLIPGNLGLKEGIIVFSAGFLGLSPDQALAAAILDRTTSMVVIFGFGFWYGKTLLDRLNIPKAGSLSFRVIREGIDGDADEGQGGKPR